jgi:site-specific recombinase XerD
MAAFLHGLLARPRGSSLCREAGIEGNVSIHSLGHPFATQLYRETGDLYLVPPVAAGWGN